MLANLIRSTAVYGLSTIVGRLLNYFLVPIYTAVLLTQQYGVVTDFYAFAGLLFVVFSRGMGTAYFRFTNDELNAKQRFADLAYSQIRYASILTLIGFISIPLLSNWFGYTENPFFWYALFGILWCDAIVLVVLSELRRTQKHATFVTIQLSGILLSIGLNLYSVYFRPEWMENFSLLNSDSLYGFANRIFIANLSSSAFYLLITATFILKFKPKLKLETLSQKQYYKYAGPLVLIATAGLINEVIDRILLKQLLPYTLEENLSQIGIYGAVYKLSILVTLFVQAYRLGLEPYFFSKQKENQKQLIEVNTWFLIAVFSIGLMVLTNMSWLQLFIGEDYRVGVYVLPWLLLANCFLGLSYAISHWYKAADKTLLGAGITLVGAILTILGNVLFIPKFGILASAVTTCVSYGVICILSIIIGNQYLTAKYPIAYFFLIILLYCVLSLIIIYFFNITQFDLTKIIVQNVISIGFILCMLYVNYKRLIRK